MRIQMNVTKYVERSDDYVIIKYKLPALKYYVKVFIKLN